MRTYRAFPTPPQAILVALRHSWATVAGIGHSETASENVRYANPSGKFRSAANWDQLAGRFEASFLKFPKPRLKQFRKPSIHRPRFLLTSSMSASLRASAAIS